jgi:hypothetical protein
VLIISTSITGAMLYFFLGNFVTSEKEKGLVEVANNLNEFLEANAELENTAYVRQTFQSMVDFYGRQNNSLIFIGSDDGNIHYISNPERVPESILKKLYTVNGWRFYNEQQYRVFQSDHTSVVKEVGNFYGLYQETNVAC